MSLFQYDGSRPWRRLGFLTALGLGLCWSQLASADEACGSSVCSKGFECKTVTGGCLDLACLGEQCEPCAPTTSQVCVPAACTVDTDCAADMLCVSQGACTADVGSCDGPDCPTRSPASCESAKVCVPRYMLPCESEASCGAGFTCEEEQSCTCAGGAAEPASPPDSGSGSGAAASATAGTGAAASSASSGSGGTGSGAAPSEGARSGSEKSEPRRELAEPQCSCAPSGRNVCRVIPAACDVDADCVAGWSCKPNPASTCYASSDGTRGCTPADPANVCVPPYQGVAYDGGVRTTTDGAGTVDLKNPATPNSEAAAPGSSSGGCSVTPGSGSGAPLGVGLVAFAAAFGTWRRRRARSSAV